MRRLRRNLIIMFANAAVLLASLCVAEAQYTRSRPIRVHTPGVYNRTRSIMSRRAAMRKVVRKRLRAARKRHRH